LSNLKNIPEPAQYLLTQTCGKLSPFPLHSQVAIQQTPWFFSLSRLPVARRFFFVARQFFLSALSIGRRQQCPTHKYPASPRIHRFLGQLTLFLSLTDLTTSPRCPEDSRSSIGRRHQCPTPKYPESPWIRRFLVQVNTFFCPRQIRRRPKGVPTTRDPAVPLSLQD
jgi:hypothetical protein